MHWFPYWSRVQTIPHSVSAKGRFASSICKCQVRGLLTVFDRLTNRRVFGEMGRMPKVQLKASHCVLPAYLPNDGKSVHQSLHKLSNLSILEGYWWLCINAFSNFFFNALTFISSEQVEGDFQVLLEHMLRKNGATFGDFSRAVNSLSSHLHFSFSALKADSGGAAWL